MRDDIPLADQVVQVGHACLEAGRTFAFQDNTHMVVLRVKDSDGLRDAFYRMQKSGIDYKVFYEPDDDMGHTALCTEPVSGSQRNVFRRYKLWS